MNEISYVVVFPTIFSKNKISQLVINIKKILKIKNQQFKSVKRDGDVILVDANDPVFASSAINLLFGIEKIVIARQTKNDFQKIVSEITSISGNLLLKGEKFLVKVEGISKGFLVKDIEIAYKENFRSVEHLKRYTTLGMGTDQGKISSINSLGIVSKLLNEKISEVGTTTYRPPYAPLSFSAIAGRSTYEFYDPQRKTPIHNRRLPRPMRKSAGRLP